MNRSSKSVFHLWLAAMVLACVAGGVKAQQAPTPATPEQQKQAEKPQQDQEKDKDADDDDEGKNPFAPEPPQPLPLGTTGSDTHDPRYSLTPGLYNAGETSMGI